jgi:hypothetical protein
MLSRGKVLQTIKKGKEALGIEDLQFEIRFSGKPGRMMQRAEIFIQSGKQAKIVLYPTATIFSVRHELCHAKLFRMGIPLTNTKQDVELLPDQESYMRMVVIVEWYINELQKRVFHEYYAVDEAGAPKPPPFPDLPELPTKRFTAEQISEIVEIAQSEKQTMPT